MSLVLTILLGCGGPSPPAPSPEPVEVPDIEALYTSWPAEPTAAHLAESAEQLATLRAAWEAVPESAPSDWTGKTSDFEIALLRWSKVEDIDSQVLATASAWTVVNSGALSALPPGVDVSVDVAGGVTFKLPAGEVGTDWVISTIAALATENETLGFKESVLDVDGASHDDAEGWFLALEELTQLKTGAASCRFGWNPETEGRVLGSEFGELNEIEVRSVR